jgi:hypothetical protein
MTHPRINRLKLALAGIITLAVAFTLSLAPGLRTQAQAPSAAATPVPCSDTSPGQINSTMYFQSKPQDAAQCGMSVAGGKIVTAAAVTNPAMTCPDMSSWKLFAEIVSQEFWKGWAADEETWPSTPLPLCGTPGSDTKNCCSPDGKNNPGYNLKDGQGNPVTYRGALCPYFPGDHPENPPESFGQPPSKAHSLNFARAGAGVASSTPTSGEPGRDIRQSMAELVFRNKPMFNYVFRNNLYNQEGVISVFNRNSGNISGELAGLPYRVRNGNGDGKTALVEIDFPVESVMIKSNWINADYAQKNLGLRDDPRNPYVTMLIESADTDNNKTSDGRLVEGPGTYWLVAFHVSSKDTPNWLWTTFEHDNNPGRCDFIGCNDSYGYSSPDNVAVGLAANFTSPKIKCDNLPIDSYVFDTGKTYPGGAISPSLKGVLQGMGIGTGTRPKTDPKMPSRSDGAWLSYRLKGSQTQFTDSMGNVGRLGNSVTEGGFVSSSSCSSCHARAGTAATGTLPPALGVFVNEVSDRGYGQSFHGTPDPDWFHRSGQPPNLSVLQVDFVWGFLNANRISQPAATLTSAPNVRNFPTAGSVRSRIRRP